MPFSIKLKIKMNKKLIVLGLLYAFGTGTNYAQTAELEVLNEVIVSDSRFELKRENSGKTIVKISAEELERKRGQTLSDIINSKSGITINGTNSAAGQTRGTYVRGGQNRQVLVLIDGIALSDPSQIENNFDLNLIALDQIESIEILKGASSVLYGNRASSAVINITLKKASNENINASFSSFFGTNNNQEDSRFDIADFTNSIGLNGSVDKLNYMVNFNHRYTDGLSAIKSKTENLKSDPFSKLNSNVKIGYQLSDNFNISAFGSYDEYETVYDESFGFLDADYNATNVQKRVGVSPTFNYNKGSITVNSAYNTSEREYESAYPAKFESNSVIVDAFNKYKFSEKLFTIVGLNYVKTEMDSYGIPFGGTSFAPEITSDFANDEIIDPYLNATYISDYGLNLNAGLRLNNHSEYGSHFVYNVNPSYVFKKDNKTYKLMSSMSTAYITPSLYQLFAPYYGNSDLNPQEDTTIEVGIAFDLENKLSISALYFNRKQNSFIDYVILDYVTYAGEYQNLNEDYNVKGVEVELNYNPLSNIVVNANYTFTERKDGDLYRVPKHKVNASIDFDFKTKTSASLNYQFNSERISPYFNDDFTANRILKFYSLLNLNLNQVVIKDRLKLFASISNIFNKDYEELYHFSTLGRNYKLGFSLNF